MTNTSICPIPWNHISIQQNGDFRICCQIVHAPFGKLSNNGEVANVNNTTIDDARNLPEVKKLRVDMMSGVKNSLCKLCYDEEASGLYSKRHAMHEKYSESFVADAEPNGTIDTNKTPLRYIDIRFGNLCNLKCRYCGPTDSNLWYEDFTQMYMEDRYNTQGKQISIMPFYGTKKYEISKTNKIWGVNSLDFKWYEGDKFWAQLKTMIPYIDRYYFTGGEPTINKAHFDLLDLIIESGNASNVVLEYNTNMFAIPNTLYTQWSHFKAIEIGCSIDGMNDFTNYLRPPSTWEKIEANLDVLGQHELNNISACISTTVSVFNILHFLDLIEWSLNKKYKTFESNGYLPAFHMLVGPDYMNVQILPNDVKAEITLRYKQFLQDARIKYSDEIADELIKRYDSILTFMNATDNSKLLSKLKDHTMTLDSIRNQKLNDVIPWLHNIIKDL